MHASISTARRILPVLLIAAFLTTTLRAQMVPVLPQEDEDDVVVVAVADPFENFNRAMFRFNDGAFTYVLRPINRGYEFVVPSPVRKGLGNAFDNVKFPVRFAGSLLQGKVRRATRETGKFVVNTVGGVGGLLRPAEKIPALADLPEEDLGQVFAVWGMPAGPYLVLPLLGPSNPREVLGFAGDYVLMPTNWDSLNVGNRTWIDEDYRTLVTVTEFVSALPSVVGAYDAITGEAIDPYIALRDAYASHRETETKK